MRAVGRSVGCLVMRDVNSLVDAARGARHEALCGRAALCVCHSRGFFAGVLRAALLSRPRSL